jgi:glycosyltransferase involved in cell wall biosynthesis
VVVVIDGAEDDTLDAAKATVSMYQESSVTIIVQPNQGLSSARNTGIRASSAKYITFLDADDFWLPEFLEVLVPILSDKDADVVEYDANIVDETGSAMHSLKIASAPSCQVRASSRSEFLDIFRCYAWARIYASSIFDCISFPAGRRFEDTATVPWAYWYARNIFSVGRPLIGYRQRTGSILATPAPSDIDDILSGGEAAIEMLRSTKDDYWRRVAIRAFQQACSRTTAMPVSSWPSYARAIRSRMPNDLKKEANPSRALQLRHTLAYIAMLYFKRTTIDKLKRSLSIGFSK